MPTAKCARLTAEQDHQLQLIENNPLRREKVRLRAKVIRVSHRGMRATAIAEYTGRNYRSLRRDLERWEKRGMAGLNDGSVPGNRGSLGEVEQQWLRKILAEGVNDTAGDLAAGLRQQFGVRANRDNVRRCRREMGDGWQHNRYVPVKEVGCGVNIKPA